MFTCFGVSEERMIDYESPVKVFQDEIQMQIENEIMKAVCRVGVEVDKEELLKALKYDRGQYEKGYKDGKNASEWIPVSERLPEDRKEKLVYLSSNRIAVAVYNEHRLSHSDCSIGWGYRVPYGYIDFEKETVIAWQPLPEPYR